MLNVIVVLLVVLALVLLCLGAAVYLVVWASPSPSAAKPSPSAAAVTPSAKQPLSAKSFSTREAVKVRAKLVDRFVSECCQMSEQDYMASYGLYDQYVKFCRRNGAKDNLVYGDNGFSYYVRKTYQIRLDRKYICGKQERVMIGICSKR